MSNEQKRVVVTGASSGIGRAVAVRFAGEGWAVCLNGRREEALRNLAAGLPEPPLLCPGDYRDAATAERLAGCIRERWGVVDALINCAGVYRGAPVIESPLDQWRKPMDIMIDGAVAMTRTVVPFMTGGGRIVHVTSIHGERAEKNSSAYAMAKAAVNQYCRGLALELADNNILVNAIAPGFVDTPMSVIDGKSELESDWFRKNYVEGHHLPLRRAGRPEEIAGVAFFLAGPDATYLTGQVIAVDGGLTITF